MCVSSPLTLTNEPLADVLATSARTESGARYRGRQCHSERVDRVSALNAVVPIVTRLEYGPQARDAVLDAFESHRPRSERSTGQPSRRREQQLRDGRTASDAIRNLDTEMARIDVKIPEGLADLLVASGDSGHFRGKSDAARTAIRSYFRTHPAAALDALESLIADEEHEVTVSDAVRLTGQSVQQLPQSVVHALVSEGEIDEA